MSFTVFYTKNGVERPIKMSILDAFRGVPDMKPRKPKSCSCCGNVHQKHRDSDKKKSGQITKDDDLTKDDRTMLRLKEEKPSRPWSDILDATGFKDKSMAVARWKEIEHKVQADSNKDNSKKSEPKKKKQKDNDPEREAKDARNREEGLRKKAEAKKNAEAGNKMDYSTKENHKDDKAKASISGHSSGNAKNGQPEINDIKAFADGYDKKKWQMVASKHYDKTGERITAAQAKVMANGK